MKAFLKMKASWRYAWKIFVSRETATVLQLRKTKTCMRTWADHFLIFLFQCSSRLYNKQVLLSYHFTRDISEIHSWECETKRLLHPVLQKQRWALSCFPDEIILFENNTWLWIAVFTIKEKTVICTFKSIDSYEVYKSGSHMYNLHVIFTSFAKW